jgi:hypothetical protein
MPFLAARNQHQRRMTALVALRHARAALLAAVDDRDEPPGTDDSGASHLALPPDYPQNACTGLQTYQDVVK